jgi:hypothetical protein
MTSTSWVEVWQSKRSVYPWASNGSCSSWMLHTSHTKNAVSFVDSFHSLTQLAQVRYPQTLRKMFTCDRYYIGTVALPEIHKLISLLKFDWSGYGGDWH